MRDGAARGGVRWQDGHQTDKTHIRIWPFRDSCTDIEQSRFAQNDPLAIRLDTKKMRQHSGIYCDRDGGGDWSGSWPIAIWVDRHEMDSGLLTIFCRHTSASLLIQENAAPEVRADLEDFFAHIAPEDASYAHDDEGPDECRRICAPRSLRCNCRSR